MWEKFNNWKELDKIATLLGLVVSALYAFSYLYNVGFLKSLQVDISIVPITFADLSKDVIVMFLPLLAGCAGYWAAFWLFQRLIFTKYYGIALGGTAFLGVIYLAGLSASHMSAMYFYLLGVYAVVRGALLLALKRADAIRWAGPLRAAERIGAVLPFFLLPCIAAYDTGFNQAFTNYTSPAKVYLRFNSEPAPEYEVRLLKYYDKGVLFSDPISGAIRFRGADGAAIVYVRQFRPYELGWLYCPPFAIKCKLTDSFHMPLVEATQSWLESQLHRISCWVASGQIPDCRPAPAMHG